MAYPKITVNTGLSIEIIASDTIPIPDPGLPQLTGRTSGVQTDKLIDGAKNFTTNGVVIGDIIYNTTDNTVVTITAIDSATTLSISANLFVADEDYIIFQGGPLASDRIKSNEGCLLYVGSNETVVANSPASPVNIKVKTVAGNDVIFQNFPVGRYLPIQILQLYSTDTTVSARVNSLAIW